MSRAKTPTRVLSLCPTHRGIGCAVMEAPTELVDWGVKSARMREIRATLAKVAELIEHYSPEVVLLEDFARYGSRRCQRVKRLLAAIRSLAARRHVSTASIPLQRVRQMFVAYGATTKHQIVQAIAKQLPDLALHLPRRRKPWMNEDYWMPSFDAVAFALTYFNARVL